MDVNQQQVAAAVGRIPSGVAVLTARHGGRATGMLASWFQQASREPLMITVCVKQGRPIEALIDDSGKFVLNILGEDPKEVFKHFGRGFAPEEDAFVGLAVGDVAGGVTLAAAVARIECSVVARMPAGDHLLYLGEATAGDADLSFRPHVHVRKSGLGY